MHVTIFVFFFSKIICKFPAKYVDLETIASSRDAEYSTADLIIVTAEGRIGIHVKLG